MKDNKKSNLFISYSHLDEDYIKEFIKHITPLKRNNLIEEWYDRKIIPGKDFQNSIDNKLENADIICLFISSNFLSSNACMKEKRNAFELKNEKGTSVVPIILSTCGWLDDHELSVPLALPADGKPITDFNDSNKAWNDVYNGIKEVIGKVIIIKQLVISKEFSSFLENTELLSKAHSQKERVLLGDIFIFPELDKYDDLREYEKIVVSENLCEDFNKYSKILIAGENQSGKTTLCKKIFLELLKKNYVPIYISDKNELYKGRINNRIKDSFKQQYEETQFEEVDKQRIVPILDDFHFAKNKEKNLNDLSIYSHQIIIVDDIFSLNFKDENLIRTYTHFKIKEFNPSLRNQLIKKWIYLTDKKDNRILKGNKFYQSIDNKTNLVNTALGKVIGSGIMPAYPFFILTIISTYETFAKPLDQEITSQGYCYQALIYMYLRKHDVRNEDIEIYLNFLTEFAFYFFKEQKNELSNKEFEVFMSLYLKNYNLPIKKEVLLRKLQLTQIIELDDCNNYSFPYKYLYYFFVAKHLADHVDKNKKEIDSIIQNLHKDENSYIAIFISHHSKDDYILDKIISNAYSLFKDYKPATLSKDELSFFDKEVNNIVNAALKPANISPEKEREKKLKEEDKNEENKKAVKEVQNDKTDNKLEIELRRSIKTVEVMGRIIRNRAGSLLKPRLEDIFKEGMKIHLRILSSFFEVIKYEEGQKEIVEYISSRINKFINDKAEERKNENKKERKPSKEELEKISKIIFWNTNFFFIYGMINKIINSLGSNKLIEIVETVCDNENSPASFLVKHGILMWYNKNLQIDNISNRIEQDGFSETSKKVMKFIIVNHCSMHQIGFKEKQKIEHKFNISTKRLFAKKSLKR